MLGLISAIAAVTFPIVLNGYLWRKRAPSCGETRSRPTAATIPIYPESSDYTRDDWTPIGYWRRYSGSPRKGEAKQAGRAERQQGKAAATERTPPVPATSSRPSAARLKDYQEVDEREAFDALEVPEQQAIRFLLDCAVLRPGLPGFQLELLGAWQAENQYRFGLTRTLAAYDRFGIVPDLAGKLANKEPWGNAEAFFGGAVTIAVFCRMNSFIRTFAAFDLLFLRLFGGEVRLLTPALFAAAFLHPDVSVDARDTQELEQATMARLTQS
jgi:hypothetical protein